MIKIIKTGLPFAILIISIVALFAITMISYSEGVITHERAHALSCKYLGGDPVVNYNQILIFKYGGTTQCKSIPLSRYDDLALFASIQEEMDYPMMMMFMGMFGMHAILLIAIFIMLLVKRDEMVGD